MEEIWSHAVDTGSHSQIISFATWNRNHKCIMTVPNSEIEFKVTVPNGDCATRCCVTAIKMIRIDVKKQFSSIHSNSLISARIVLTGVDVEPDDAGEATAGARFSSLFLRTP